MAIFQIDLKDPKSRQNVFDFDVRYRDEIPEGGGYRTPKIPISVGLISSVSLVLSKKFGMTWNAEEILFRMIPTKVLLSKHRAVCTYSFLPYNVGVGDDSLSEILSKAKIGVLACPGGLIKIPTNSSESRDYFKYLDSYEKLIEFSQRGGFVTV